jgi:protein-S-isoprenylcysteine O-methyltransferase Ste14
LLTHVLLLGRIVVGTIAFVVGIGMVIGANRIGRRIGTNVNPSQPIVALATTVVFTWTRNPMYAGGASRSSASQSLWPSIWSCCSCY